MKIADPEAARAIVQQKKKDGYEALKVSEFLTPQMLAVITDEAHKLGMGVTGHSWDVVGYANSASTASSTSGRSATRRSWI
jgi:hypothetical protein